MVAANWNQKQVGPSKNYEELELDNFAKKVHRTDADVVISIYGDGCELCQELHPKQEKAAEKVKRKLTKLGQEGKIRFARFDMQRFGGEGAMTRAVPDFADAQIPRMHFVKAGKSTPMKIDHSSIGWAPTGHTALYDWIKEHSTLQVKGFQAKAKKDDL